MCLVLVQQGTNVCKPCDSLRLRTMLELNRKESALKSPAKPKVPLKFTSPERLKLALQEHRTTIQRQNLECQQLKDRIEEMKVEIAKSSCSVDKTLDKDFGDIFKNCPQEKVPPFMRLLKWEEQQYLRASSRFDIIS